MGIGERVEGANGIQLGGRGKNKKVITVTCGREGMHVNIVMCVCMY